MILMTESPNQNIFQWASNYYVQDKGIRKMIYSGYKPESHWNSIIAQMLIIFYVMDKYSFTIREMNISANFYVKDLNVYGDNKQFWQYTIENIDYYVPSSGVHKIIMKNEFGDDDKIIKTTIVDNAINCFNPNNFSGQFLEMGGVALTSKVGELFSKLYNDLKDSREKLIEGKEITWGYFIKKYLIQYIHNRVGTSIRDLEVNYIRKTETRAMPFKPGELVVWEEKYETFKIVLWLSSINKTTCKCISKNDATNEYIPIDCPVDMLYHYSEFETIKQDGKQGEPMIGYDYIIERYIL